MLFLPSAFTWAQIGSAQSQVNIIISQVHTIQVSQPSVSIDMSDISHYISGSSSGQQTDHVKVVSSSAYQVTVKSATQYFSLNGGATTLPVNTIAVNTTTGSDLTGTNAQPPAGLVVTPQVQLSTTAATIVNSPEGEWGRGYNVNYSIPQAMTPNYMNRDNGTYTTTVTYTLVPQ
jgi:hypothetical protein